MLRKKTKALIRGILLGLGICIFAGMSIYHKQEANVPIYQQETKIKEEKVDYTDLIIKNLEKINKLEVLQLNMNIKMTMHGSKYTNKLFKNDKIINLNTTARYKIDITDLKNDIIFNGNNITVLVHIEKEVFVNEDKTSYQEDKGYLAFYDVEVTPEEYNSMIIEAKSLMEEEMMKEENYNEAKKQVEEKVKEMVNNLEKSYNVNVKFY